MKRFAIVGLSMLCLSLAATTSVKAGSRTERISMSTATATTSNDTVNSKTTPLALPIRSRTRTESIAMSIATTSNDSTNLKLTPFALVSLAYQGEYRMQGIPGFGSFKTAVSSKTVTAKDLVAAAIAANQLTSDTQTDAGYLNAVNLQLLVNRI
jgi:hypothetical protein